tara:strand:- start:1676 stop:4108 length:2433 start_codon:yes stop_codon:yes gene_type:complete
MQINKELELAWNFVEKTNRNIFLTGKAGTGKTTFLRKIKKESKKRLIVVAPTGVAAINAKGVTIHSFFQMPFGPIIPGENQQRSAYKFNKTKINIIRSLDLLVIDEISMVRADLLDGIDQVLRKYKNRNQVFGGVQLLLIGDLQQLAPVVRPNEWDLLQAHYENAFFFSSHSYKLSNPIGIELNHIYRQDDEKFIKILNEIRNNNLSEQSSKVLNERFIPDFEATEKDDYIILTTHNNKADSLNDIAFNKLSNKIVSYKATIQGKFPEFSYPSQENLGLKVGAQVMFTKNDSSFEKRFFNGKIGEIISLGDDKLTVKCTDGNITVVPETWENVSYTLNNLTKEIEEKKAGSFTQIPLKLAWAITIHKSQGLTFEKAIIDAGASFAHGQTYVALSRCKTLEGIVLKTKINPSSIINDNRVQSFTQDIESNIPSKDVLTNSEKGYYLNLINDLFNYQSFLYPNKRMLDIFYKNSNSIEGNIIEKVPYILENIEKLMKISLSFDKQITILSHDIENLETAVSIQERIQKGIHYFLNFTKDFITKPLKELTFSSENQEVKKTIRFHLKNFQDALNVKLFCLNGIEGNFTTSAYLQLRAEAVLQDIKTEKPKGIYNTTTEHPELLNFLVAYRNLQANTLGIERPQIFIQRSLYEMCETLPCTLFQLKMIKGMGKVKVEKYGEEIIQIIINYCQNNNITLTQDTDKPKKVSKGVSQLVSLELFKDGKSIQEIAKERELAEGTIVSHLAQFVATGELEAIQLMSEDKLHELKQLMENTKFDGFGELKNKIAAKFSYADIKIVYNGLEYEKSLKLKEK